MKKSVLIVLGMFLMVSTVKAKKNENSSNRFEVNYYTYNNAVSFFERGIEFFIFTNGDFDFDVNYTNRGLRIQKDFRGRIRRIGNVNLRYDFRGNVTRIGNIHINYFRNRLRNVGDLKVRYDRWGQPIFQGNVRDFYYDNGIRFNIDFGDVFGYNDVFFRRNSFRRNYVQIREDRNFFYYRAKPNAKIGDKSNIIKRRKAATVSRNKSSVSRRQSTHVYRKNDVNKRKSLIRNVRNSQRSSVKKNEIRKRITSTERKQDLRISSVKRTLEATNTSRRTN